jgi:nicotinate phosphoribosyltransferase
LIDTYDTEAAAIKVVNLAPALKERGITINAVRIDSGDLGKNAAKVRAILDEAGLHDVGIFASGNLDEYALRDLVGNGAPIGGFGIGTLMSTSSDAPYLDCAYKLQEYAGRARRKRSEGKATWPGRKQVYRTLDSLNRMTADMVTLHDETPEGEALLVPVMRRGRRLASPQPLPALRQHTAAQLALLPERLRELETSEPYEVTISTSLRESARTLDGRNLNASRFVVLP